MDNKGIIINEIKKTWVVNKPRAGISYGIIDREYGPSQVWMSGVKNWGSGSTNSFYSNRDRDPATVLPNGQKFFRDLHETIVGRVQRPL